MDIQKEREAFELSFKSTQIYCRECAIRGKDILEFSKTVNGYFNIVTNDAWNIWLDAKAQAVPEGFVLLPKEPTQTLFRAFYDAFNACEGGNTAQYFKAGYRAMTQVKEQNS